jgi:tetratricopeptide (TPR) repeat protein
MTLTLPKPFSLLLRGVLAAICLVTVWYSALLGRAEFLLREGSVASVSEAVNLVPQNPAYLIKLADLQPSRSVDLLRRALALNEYNARLWIQLGVNAEFQKNEPALAEHEYQRAAEIDHMFFTRTNLLNFYFRSNRRDDFFRALPAVLQMSYADPRYFFAQIWSLSSDPRFNAGLLPEKLNLLLPYVDFLLQTNRFDYVESASQRALARIAAEHIDPREIATPLFPQNSGPVSYLTFFGSVLDRLLAANRYQIATNMSSDLHRRGWIESSAPKPLAPVTNGEFRQPSFQHGFDWVFLQNPGVTVEQLPQSSRLALTFTGSEPESCQLIQQYVVLAPNHRYRLRWNAQSDTIPQGSGITWQLAPVNDQGLGIASKLVSPDLLKNGTETIAWDFTAQGQALNLLTMQYERRLGTTRPEGELALHSVSLTELP